MMRLLPNDVVSTSAPASPSPSRIDRTLFDRRALLLAMAGGIAAATTAFVPGRDAAAAFKQTPSTTAAFEQILADGIALGVPGISVAVEQGGDLLFSGAAGVASLELDTPLKPTDRFRIYSITKTFTATVVFQLVEEGKLSLDDTVATWIGDADGSGIPNLDTATIRQVLNHTSGIYDFGDDDDSPFWDDAFLGPDADWSKVWTLPELLAYADVANHPPYFAPGEGFYYSNTNYLLLGMIIEQVTGRSYGDELQDRIFTPLGLADTALAMGGTIPDGVVDGYQLLDGELVNVSSINLSWVWAAGGIVSTTADLLRFSAATFSGELLSAASRKELFTFIPSQNPTLMFGSGLYQETTDFGTLVGMDGGSAGFSANMMHLADEDITVVVLINQSPDNGVGEGVRNQLFTSVIGN